MDVAIEFENLTKEYRSLTSRRRVRALDGFTLQVERGEIFGFLGPNGAGKTTAINLVMGFMKPTSGRGLLLGSPFGHAATRRRVGFLAENVALYHRPAERLVRFYGALNAMRGRELRSRARAVLHAVGLEEQSARNVGGFSRGMAQRVGLAQALVNDPEVLILDEPASALDPLARVTVRELLLAARENGKTIFLSSHLLSEVELICDRVAVLHHGKLLRVGRTTDLLQASDQVEIVVRGLAPDLFPGAVGTPRLLKVCVHASAQRATLEKIWSLGGEVFSLNPVRQSLEDVFLAVTNDAPRPKDIH